MKRGKKASAKTMRKGTKAPAKTVRTGKNAPAKTVRTGKNAPAKTVRTGKNAPAKTVRTGKNAPAKTVRTGTKAPLKTVRRGNKRVVLLSGGNPQIAKADGDAPVRAYIAALSGWKRDVAKRLDALVVRTVPGVRKAVKWNSPFYGVEGRGWFLSFHMFTKAVKVTFFNGTSLQPVPPGGTSKDARWIDVHERDLDEAQMARWVKQSAALPGWMA